jgi:hypothetical protein
MKSSLGTVTTGGNIRGESIRADWAIGRGEVLELLATVATEQSFQTRYDMLLMLYKCSLTSRTMRRIKEVA